MPHSLVPAIDQGTVGGFGSFVLHHLATAGLLDHGVKIRPMVLPDRFIDHDKPAEQRVRAGLDADGIVVRVTSSLGTLAAPTNTVSVGAAE